jgi:hypothetical protein
MELVYFTVVGIALYLISDRIVNFIETKRGARLEHRSILFFAIILTLSLIAFNVIQRLYQEAGTSQTSTGQSASQISPVDSPNLPAEQ